MSLIMTYRFLVPEDLGVNVLTNIHDLLGSLRDWHFNLRMLGSPLLHSSRDHFSSLHDPVERCH